MADYIKRDDAIRSIADHDEFKGERWIKEAWADYLIEDAKPADVAPVRHGRWIECTSSPHWKCSMCGTKAPIWFNEFNEICEWLSDYCPNCGAKMDEGETNE